MDKVEYDRGYQDAINALKNIMNGGNGDPNNPQNQQGNQGQQNNQNGTGGQNSKDNNQGNQGDKGNSSDQSGKNGKDSKSGKDSKNKGGEVANPGIPSDIYNKAADEGVKKGTRKKDKPGKGQEETNNGSSSGNSGKPQQGHGAANSFDQRDYVKKQAEEVIKKYQNKLSGAFGDFVRKCKVSAKDATQAKGMVTYAKKAAPHWNKAFKSTVETYISQLVYNKHREMERTFSRIKRGSGFIEYGDPIFAGKKLKEDKLNITLAYYIDRSGSMSGRIDNVFSLAYEISKMIHKQNVGDKVVGAFDFKYYAFDTVMHEITGGKKVSADGGTMDLDDIIEFMTKNTRDYLMNIVITDAGFSIDDKKIISQMKDLGGMVIIITNEDSEGLHDIEKKSKGKIKWIRADSEFTLK